MGDYRCSLCSGSGTLTMAPAIATAATVVVQCSECAGTGIHPLQRERDALAAELAALRSERDKQTARAVLAEDKLTVLCKATVALLAVLPKIGSMICKHEDKLTQISVLWNRTTQSCAVSEIAPWATAQAAVEAALRSEP